MRGLRGGNGQGGVMDIWEWWGKKLTGMPVLQSPNEPQCGFYRKTQRERYGARKTFLPVAYYPDQETGEMRLRIGDNDIDPGDKKFLETWTSVCDRPVSEQAYRQVAELGGLWPDEHELVGMQGHNRPPDDSTYEGLRDAIEPLAQEAKVRISGPPVADQDDADRLANLADRLAELAKEAEAARKEERAPHDEALKAIQKRWLPVLDLAELYKEIKYRLLTPWLKKLEEAQQEE